MTDISAKKWLKIFFDSSESASEQRSVLRRICSDLGKNFNFDLAEALENIISNKIQKNVWKQQEIFSDLESLTGKSKIAEYLYLTLSESNIPSVFQFSSDKLSVVNEKKNLLENFENGLDSPDPRLSFQRVQNFMKESETVKAFRLLQLIYSRFPDYSFYLKSQAAVSKILDNVPENVFKRKVRLAVLGSCTTGFLLPVLKASAMTKGVLLEIYEGLYGNYNQEILDPDSDLYRFKPDVVFILLESHDFKSNPLTDSGRADEYIARIKNLRNILAERSSAHLIHTGLDMPLNCSWSSLEYTLDEGRRRQIHRINDELSRDLPGNVSFINPELLSQLYGGKWAGERNWYMSKQYPEPDALPVLADAVIAQICAVYGLTKKVLVLDLDNTCWGGIIGEDGLDGIHIGPSSAGGESFSALQRYAKELQQRGILLAVCSKNNEKDALLPFEKHSDMILKRSDFVAFKANWNDKAVNIREIASELNLGLDSFVFVDDNPIERANIRRNIPEVAVPEFDNIHWKIVPVLQRSMFFESIALTKEDRKRHNNYLLRAKANEVAKSSGNMDDFLSGLNMKCACLPVDQNNISRVTQLINKSNQFNLTTRRYNQEQIRERAVSKNWFCRAFRLSDCYDDYGIVGILFAEKNDKYWRIDTLVMSCRVIGRRLEELMLASLYRFAKKTGSEKIIGEYIPTEKNALVSHFYEKQGFMKKSPADVNVINFNNTGVSSYSERTVPARESKAEEFTCEKFFITETADAHPLEIS